MYKNNVTCNAWSSSFKFSFSCAYKYLQKNKYVHHLLIIIPKSAPWKKIFKDLHTVWFIFQNVLRLVWMKSCESIKIFIKCFIKCLLSSSQLNSQSKEYSQHCSYSFFFYLNCLKSLKRTIHNYPPREWWFT